MEMWSQNTWVFWLFPIMGLFIIQIYCALRCYRSGWFQAIRERWFGAQQGEAGNIQEAQIAAEAVPVAAGAAPPSSYGAMEGDQGSQLPYVSMNSRVLEGAHVPLSFPPPLPPPSASSSDRAGGTGV